MDLTEKYEYNGWPSIQRPDIKPPEGWNLSLITSVNRVRNHQLSPDGQRVAFIWDREELSDVYLMPAAGGWPVRVSTNRGPIAYWSDEIPQWSPDGEWLAFSIGDHVHIVSTGGGIPRRVVDFVGGTSSPVWLPDSQRLIVSLERAEATKLFLTDRDGTFLRALTIGSGDDWDAQPSPDGTWIAFVHRPHDDLNRQEIRLLEVESGEIRSLTGKVRMADWWPRWSPDGKQIAFLSQRSGWNEVWLVRPDGGAPHQLTHLGRDVADLAWSPDGSRIACTLNRDGAFQLALIAVQSGEVTTLRGGQGYHSRPNWSPDGSFLTVEYEDPIQPPELYRIEPTGGTVQQLTFSNPPALAQQELVVPEQVSYPSFDGQEIPAFLYRPRRPNGAAILYPHGGPRSQYVYEWDILAQYFIAKGYTWLAPNYRGSTGYGLAFERANENNWGVGDTQDCLYGAKFLHALPEVDRERIAIYGGSYGGYMVAACLSRDPEHLFACGVSKYGDANVTSSWAQCNRDIRLYTEMQLGHPGPNRQVYLDASPILQVENVQRPVLILHGLDDDVVPPQASEEWVHALRRADKTFEYKTYAGEPHGFLKRATQLDAYARMERFLDWYLMA